MGCGQASNNEMAIHYARERVKERLKAPTQADFIDTKLVAGREDTCYVAWVTVDAPNSFGVKLRQNYLVSLKMKGDSVFWNRDYVVQESSGPPTQDEVWGAAVLNGIYLKGMEGVAAKTKHKK